MSSIQINGNTSGSITIEAPAVAGTNTITLPASTGTLLTTTGDGSALTGTGLGVGQAWVSVTASRALSTTYTNSTGKPILVEVYVGTSSFNGGTLTIDGVSAASTNNASASLIYATLSGIVPDSSTYSVAAAGGLFTWSELR